MADKPKALSTSRVEPFIRRAVHRGRTSARLVAMLGGDALDLLLVDLGPTANPEEVAAMMVGTMEEDARAGDPAESYRIVADGGEGEPEAITVRGLASKPEDPVGAALLPNASDPNAVMAALVRQAMRHSEMATMRSIMAQDAATKTLQAQVTQLQADNARLLGQSTKDAEAAGNFLRQTTESEARLLEAAAKQDGVRELGRMARYMLPRIADSMSGADKLAPALRVLSRLKPEQFEMLHSAGIISAAEVDELADLWHELRDEKRDRKALRADNGPKPEAKGEGAKSNVVPMERKRDGT